MWSGTVNTIRTPVPDTCNDGLPSPPSLSVLCSHQSVAGYRTEMELQGQRIPMVETREEDPRRYHLQGTRRMYTVGMLFVSRAVIGTGRQNPSQARRGKRKLRKNTEPEACSADIEGIDKGIERVKAKKKNTNRTSPVPSCLSFSGPQIPSRVKSPKPCT